MSNAEIGTPAKRRSPLLRVLLWLVLSIVAIVAGVSGYACYVAYSALPQLDGQLKLPGLSGPVKVTRDGHGVPTIEAVTFEDLFFAQGFVTAQDRPKSMIGDFPALLVRKTLRYLRIWDQWKLTDLEKTAALAPGTGGDLVKALQAEGLIESCADGAWCVTQAGRTFSVASAAKPVTRATAERALGAVHGSRGASQPRSVFFGEGSSAWFFSAAC